MNEHYFGSVRFFKNLILIATLALIAVPTVLAVRYFRAERQSREDMAVLEKSVASLMELADSGTAADASVREIDAETSAYQSLYPDFYAPESLNATQSTDKTAFLTFDDGPSARTPEILETLQKKGVKATFFVIGKTDEQLFWWMKDIVAQGHTIGMHSYSHNYKKIYSSVEAYLEDMNRIFQLIRDTTGVTPTVFRLPGGSINGYDYNIYQEILAEMLRRGFVPCDWNLSGGDAAGYAVTSAQVVDNVVGGADSVNRAFVLMHDAADKIATAAALPQIIAGLQGKGFTLEALTAETKPVLFGYTDFEG